MARWSREESKLPWPADVGVQGGEHGVVLHRDSSKNYGTAFVEVFPPQPEGGFIRGEGATLAEAESAAWSQYIREMACSRGEGHVFERRGYTNGAGFCTKCNGFRSGVFPELPPDPNRPKSVIEELLEAMADDQRSEQ